jgi:hypothetical protein
MKGFVLDERYTAGAGMRTTAGMQEVEHQKVGALGDAGAVAEERRVSVRLSTITY